MKKQLKTLALGSAAYLSLLLGIQSAPLSQASVRHQLSEPIVADRDAPPLDLGIWEGEVDLATGKTNFKQIKRDDRVLVAALLGTDSKITASSYWAGRDAKIYKNNPLVKNGSNQFASADISFRLINGTGATLGQTTGGGTTGIRLQLMPYEGTAPAADGTFCETGATTLQQPICVISNTVPGGKIGASGRNDGSDPVYLAYSLPSGLDNPNAPELNEATGRINPTDFARTAWFPNLTIQNNSRVRTIVKVRFRYQQTTPGNGKPRVTRFRYKFQILADRNGGGAAAPTANNAYVTTVAGDGTPTFQDGIGAAAHFNTPRGITINASGTTLYVADTKNQQIRAIDLATSQVTTLPNPGLAGFPSDLVLNPSGSHLYVAEPIVSRIWAIDLKTKDITRFSPFGNFFGAVRSIAFNSKGTLIYLTDGSNIKVFDLASRQLVTLVTGQFNSARGIAIAPNGKKLYVAERDSHRIRVVDLASNQVSTIAGDGTPGFLDGRGTASRFFFPEDVSIDSSGKTLYVADSNNHRLRAIDLATNQVTTLAGNGNGGFRDGNGTTARFNGPSSVVVNPSGTIVYSLDALKGRVRQIQAVEGKVPFSKIESLP
jgi:DNA-binding beta-propeller fold protein YncE